MVASLRSGSFRNSSVCISLRLFEKTVCWITFVCYLKQPCGLGQKWWRRKEGSNFWRWTLEKMAVDGIGTNKVDILMGLWTLHYWMKEGRLCRDRFGVTNSVMRIKKLFSVGGVRLFLNRALEEDGQQPVLSLLPSKGSWTTLTVALSCQAVHQVGLSCPI